MKDVLVPRALLRDPDAFGGTIQGDCLRGDLRIVDGRVQTMIKSALGGSPRIILPKLVEPHCHLDKCHTIHRLGQVGGDLPKAMERQNEDKANWTARDIRNRAKRGLSEAQAAGCTAVRSHVDWGAASAPPLAWSVLMELAQDWPGLQLAPLVGIDQLADPAFAAETVQCVAATNGVIGAFVRGQSEIAQGLGNLFALADRHGLMLDFHVDEGLDDYCGLEVIADAALVAGFQGPILCGHAISLMDRTRDEFQRIADKLVRAGITICALPTTNLYLQGRNDGTPDRRGITRLRELRAAGVPIIVGSDNVGDAYCPMGAHDPMAALHLAALTAHLDPPMGDWLPAITTDAARALGRTAVYVDGALTGDLLLAEADHTAPLVAGRARLRNLSA